MILKLLSFAIVLSALSLSVFSGTTSYAIDSDAKKDFQVGVGKVNSLDTAQKCQDAGGIFNAKKQCVDSSGKIYVGDPVTTTVVKIINILLYVSGIIAVVYIVIAGFRYVTSNGDSAAISKAKNNIIYALIGLAIAISAYAIVNFVIGNI